MGFKSVAILDIRSTTVTAVVGEAGVNHTYVFKGMQTEMYDGYSQGKFYSPQELQKAICGAMTAAYHSAGENHSTVFVSVPSEFTYVVLKNHQIAFPAAKRVTSADIDNLLTAGYVGMEQTGYEKINSAPLYFITSDARKVLNPVGIISNTLQANISYTLASTYFTQLINKILTAFGVKKIVYVPASLMQTDYLLNESTRVGSAILLDIGVVSSTISVAYGNGILQELTVPFGEGNIVFGLMKAFAWEYQRASDELKRANMFRSNQARKGTMTENKEYVEPKKINEVIAAQLDMLCEPIVVFLENCPTELSGKPIYVTGEGVTGIRGGIEHIYKRLSREAQVVAPTMPYYDKPSQSSRIALLDYAIKHKKAEGFFRRLFNAIGGF